MAYASRNPGITDPALVDWEHPLVGHATDNGFDIFRGLATTINLPPYVYVKDDRIQVALDPSGKPVLETAGHGGFDNDVGVIGRTLERITGGSLALPVDDLRGF